MTDDITQWLGEQLDGDERIARAACWDEQSDVWTARPPQARYEQYTVMDYLGDGVVVVTPENADDDGVGQHVAEHDPARVLREIDAKRQALSRYEAMAAGVLVMTGVESILAEYRRVILPGMALPYADRPGYREEWRP